MSARFIDAHLAGSTYCDGQMYMSGLSYLPDKEQFILARDPDNEFDPNAVKIIGGHHFKDVMYGYVDKYAAKQVAKTMDRGLKASVIDYTLCGGGEGKNFGIFFKIALEF
jgi:hypothetical protein